MKLIYHYHILFIIFNICIVKISDHLSVNRGLYSHHGIYYKKNKVIHFTGEPLSGHPAVIRVDHIDDFAKGDNIEIVYYKKCFPPKETIYRSEVCLGESDYSIISNNCEHFCQWCKIGIHYSEQVETKKNIIIPIGILATIDECFKIISRERKLRRKLRNETKQLLLKEKEKTKALEKHLANIKMELLYQISLANEIIEKSMSVNSKFHKERIKINKAINKLYNELLILLNMNITNPDPDDRYVENILFLLRQIRFLSEKQFKSLII